MAESLKSILTPSLLASIAEDRMSLPRNEPLDFGRVTESFGKPLSDELRSAAWGALVALSKVALSDMPDMMSFLPEPASRDFPELCYGLTLLLDQVPRMLCNDVDDRWTDAFFGVLAKQLIHAWFALPKDQRPDSWVRWKEEAGTSFDYWLVAHFFFSAPFVHSENEADQNIALEMTEDRRRAVEEHTGELDPYRAQRADILSDVFAFSRVVGEGMPGGDGTTMQRWIFWTCMLLDVHWPIVHKFGGYPYRNAVQGRESTADEVKWLDETNHFAEASQEVADKVRKDVEAGRWTALGSAPR